MEPPDCKNSTWTSLGTPVMGTPVAPVATGLTTFGVYVISVLFGANIPVVPAPVVIFQAVMPPIRSPNPNSPLGPEAEPATGRTGFSKEPLETVIRLLQAGAANKRVPSTIPTFNLNMQILRRAT